MLDHPVKQRVSIPKSRSILPISSHPSGFEPSGTQGRDQMSHISIHRSLLDTSSAPTLFSPAGDFSQTLNNKLTPTASVNVN